MEYLGFWVTQNVIQPINKKVETIVKITIPRRQKQVSSFIGFVNYYWDRWDISSNLLLPLTAFTSNKVKLKCKYVEQK